MSNAGGANDRKQESPVIDRFTPNSRKPKIYTGSRLTQMPDGSIVRSEEVKDLLEGAKDYLRDFNPRQ